MPKLKTVIAGLAASTALTGALVAGGATAAVAMPATAPVVADDGFGDDFGIGGGHHFFHDRGHRRQCRNHRGGWGGWGGGGWGRGRHHRHHQNICIVVRNHNFNDNQDRHRHRHEEDRRGPWGL
ncbi:hypothetical protein [Nonomuraea maritima]|uniref:hypothetical protein n=1 Tax=Nonomuraea maritima TaxID=683260 RepID=UPI00371E456A